jgi:hypothetical protein
MKTYAALCLIAVVQFCFAGEDAKIIAKSEWSKPVLLRDDDSHDIDIRGRLVILQGMVTAYGGPPTTNGAMTFVELQNLGLCGIEVYFAVTNMHCELSDAMGKPVPQPSGGAGGRGAFQPSWIHLPYNSTIRLLFNDGQMDPLALFPSGEPSNYWSLPGSDTNTYFLSGTLTLSTHTNLSLSPNFREWDYKQNRTKTMEFPKIKIIPSKICRGQQAD